MKCRSVACIWSDTPPSHRVTAIAAINHPPTLYTGGSDGSIFWWNLSESNSEIVKPVAMLCGHAAPVADLSVCYPLTSSGNDPKMDNYSNEDVSLSVPETSGALISACTDAVLCVWSRGSGHCRRRRKLPPWVGSPSIIRTLPCSSRYVCIGCCFVDCGSHVPDHHSVEGSQDLVEKEGQQRKASKCSVVIVDTYSLNIVQTVFHGNLSIGALKFMDVVLLGEDGEKHSVLLADSFGRVQLVPVLKDANTDGEAASGLQRNSPLEVANWGNVLSEGVQVISIATCRNLVALVLKSSCIFRRLTADSAIGEISFVDTLLFAEDNCAQSHVLGGIFLENGNAGNMHAFQEVYDDFSGNFAVWDSTGSVILYALSYSNAKFHCQLICEIPAASRTINTRRATFLTQLNHYLLRIESVSVDAEEPFQWKPHVTIWSLGCKHDRSGKSSMLGQKLGESNSFADWISSSEISDFSSLKLRSTSSQSVFGISENDNNEHIDLENPNNVLKGQTVSSSMVISENLFVPYAVVYGYFSGKIEIVRFDLLSGLDSRPGSPHQGVESPVSKKYFSGHTGAVLCLAAHRMFGSAEGRSFSQVLVSGSMDCTVRIWDLDTGSLIMIMHQHVAPVRQIIFPPPQTEHPWSDCFLSVGEDSCVALASLETLRVERMFPGHPSYPEKVAWDGLRGYVACICRSHSGHSGTSEVIDVLYIWDVKTGARERILRGTASHSMLDHFCKGISMNSISGSILNGNTSVSSLLLPIIEDGSSSSHSQLNHSAKRANPSDRVSNLPRFGESTPSQSQVSKGNSTPLFSPNYKHPIRCTCPFPGIATLTFDLASLMFPCMKHEVVVGNSGKQEHNNVKERPACSPSSHSDDGSNSIEVARDSVEENSSIRSLETYVLRFSLSFLHVWDLDDDLDSLLIKDMKLSRPENLIVASGLQGDKGSLTLTFPGLSPIRELWKSSSEFSAMRSLTMVSIAQRMISLSHSSSEASSALAAFYTRNFADKFPDIKPPLLQLLVGFWQDESEHIRMAARTLFHCAASRAIPLPLCNQQVNVHVKLLRSLSAVGVNRDEVSNGGTSGIGLSSNMSFESPSIGEGKESSNKSSERQGISSEEESKILAWLESFEVQDWISCVGGTSQDAMTSHIIIAAALAVWYPSLVKPSLAMLVVHPLIKLVMAMNEKYSSTAAELLAEGMEGTWKACNSLDIPRLIGDIFFQIECVSGPTSNSAGHHPLPSSIRDTLIGTLLPSLAMADIQGFLSVIERQIWSTASDSPVHLVSLTTLIRVARGSPRHLAQYLEKVVNFILHTMDPSNSVMRKNCLHSAMTALKEIVRVLPMVALNDTSTRLAVGDAIGQINNASISVYDMLSAIKVKVLDASGPPGLPNLLPEPSETAVTTVISALSFSPDGEGLVAFSEHGLMIRWWSLGTVWWEKLSRNLSPVQCTKVIFVPPWEGFSPNSSRSSIMASVLGDDRQANVQENARSLSHMDNLKLLIHNLDLSYRLEWVGNRKVLLSRHGQELATFPL
ncbi:hypothetical protein Tsubulata_015486 [Turnera subulata]|uniref:Transducin/WD40 repeat-like superfamily protein n=1 Tax=Turnera subulata TaxID=218843 RepID=A0A9Q0FRF4_9ROSI|nr:hypothetical protein Tsubulata_015486 [Turnera subulata]